MDRYLGKKYGRISKLAELREAILEAWETIGKKRLRNLLKSMPDRVKAVIEAAGGMTKY